MPIVKCKNCQYSVLPQFAGSNHICCRHAPYAMTGTGEINGRAKAYWPIINTETDGCGDGEAKPAKK